MNTFIYTLITIIIKNIVIMLKDVLLNNINVIEQIPNWISALAACYVPFVLHYLAEKNEKLRIIENQEKEKRERLEKENNEKKHNELLSIERCSKLYSAPMAKNSYPFSIKLYNYCDISTHVESKLTISYKTADSFNQNCKLLRLSLVFEEKNDIPTTKFLIDNLEIWIIDNDTLKNTIRLDHCLNKDFCNVFSNKDGTVLNIYFLFDDEYPILDYFINYTDIRIVLEGKANNSFNIVTEATWNIIANYTDTSEDRTSYNYKTTNSLLQLLRVSDKNM